MSIPASVPSLPGTPHKGDDVPTCPVWWEEITPRNVNRLYPEEGVSYPGYPPFLAVADG